MRNNTGSRKGTESLPGRNRMCKRSEGESIMADGDMG